MRRTLSFYCQPNMWNFFSTVAFKINIKLSGFYEKRDWAKGMEKLLIHFCVQEVFLYDWRTYRAYSVVNTYIILWVTINCIVYIILETTAMNPPSVFEGTVLPGYEEVRNIFLNQFKDGRNENAQVMTHFDVMDVDI